MQPFSSRRITVRRVALAVAVLLTLPACGSFAFLVHVSRHRQGEAPSASVVRVERDGSPIELTPGVGIEIGDTIETLGDYGALVAHRSDRGEVVIGPSSSVTIVDGGVQIRRGRVLLRPSTAWGRVLAPTLTVDAQWQPVVVEIAGETTVVQALTGGAQLSFQDDRWPARAVAKLERLTLTPGAEPVVAMPKNSAFNETVQWANSVDSARWLVPGLIDLGVADARAVLQASQVSAKENPVPVERDKVDIVQGQNEQPGKTITDRSFQFSIDVGARSIRAPSVIGMSPDAASAAITGAELTIGEIHEELRVECDAPKVASQSPAPGTPMLERAALNVQVALPGSMVPTLIGVPWEHATVAVERAGLQSAKGRAVYSARVPANHVVACDPVNGRVIPRGSRVTLALSRGALPAPALGAPSNGERVPAAPDGTVVFSWTGVPDAVSHEIEVRHPRGGVVLQKQVAAHESTLITRLQWQRGWNEPYQWRVRGHADDEGGNWTAHGTFTHEPPDLNVPDLVGMSWEDAGAAMTSLGLTMDRKNTRSNAIEVGKITRHDPQAGSSVKPGDPVKVWVCDGPFDPPQLQSPPDSPPPPQPLPPGTERVTLARIVRFSWARVEGAQCYEFRAYQGDNTLFTKTITDNFIDCDVGRIAGNAGTPGSIIEFQWSVRLQNDGVWGLWAAPRSGAVNRL